MPNWCMNTLTLSHPDEKVIDALSEKLERMEEYTFLHTLDEEYEYREAQEVDWHRLDKHTIEASFDTAWSPPITVYESLEKNDIEVSASFYEPGMDFAGFYMDGASETYTLGDYDDEWFENDPIGKALDETWSILDDRSSWMEEEIFE